MGPSSRVAEFKAIETWRAERPPAEPLAARRTSPTHPPRRSRVSTAFPARTTPSRSSVGSTPSRPRPSASRAPGLGIQYGGDLFVGASRTTLLGGYLMRFKLSADRRQLSRQRLAPRRQGRRQRRQVRPHREREPRRRPRLRHHDRHPHRPVRRQPLRRLALERRGLRGLRATAALRRQPRRPASPAAGRHARTRHGHHSSRQERDDGARLAPLPQPLGCTSLRAPARPRARRGDRARRLRPARRQRLRLPDQPHVAAGRRPARRSLLR